MFGPISLKNSTVLESPLTSSSNPVNAIICTFLFETSLKNFAIIGADPDPVPPSTEVITHTVIYPVRSMFNLPAEIADIINSFATALSLPHPVFESVKQIFFPSYSAGKSFVVELTIQVSSMSTVPLCTASTTALFPAAPTPIKNVFM